MDTNDIFTSESIVGMFSLGVEDDVPVALYLSEEFCGLMGFDHTHSPRELYADWKQRLRPEDQHAVAAAIDASAQGLKTTVRYTWKHPVLGWIEIDSYGIHKTCENGSVLVHGYIRGVPQDNDIVPADSEVAVLKSMITEAMMDTLAICGVTDLTNNTVTLIKDEFNIGKVLGRNFTYDAWRDTVSALIAREDSEQFDESTSRKSLLHYFNISKDEMHEEFRCLDPKTRQYRWMRLRFVRFNKEMTSRCREFFSLRDITENYHTEFKDALRLKLINGLTLPYEDIDLVNLKTGKWYSSGTGNKYAENFTMRGFYDDELARYVYMCDCTEEERDKVRNDYRSPFAKNPANATLPFRLDDKDKFEVLF